MRLDLALLTAVLLLVQGDAGAATTHIERGPDDAYLIRFGAGAGWMFPVRLADGEQSARGLPELAVSVAPLGRWFEVGLDLAIARKSEVLLKPNLKLVFATDGDLSLYLEGSVAVFSDPDGTRVGGGGGFGISCGLTEHLALDFRGTVLVFNDRAETHLAPGVGARVMARF